MSKHKKHSHSTKPGDDDLLAHAIPIEQIEDADELEEAEEIEEVETADDDHDARPKIVKTSEPEELESIELSEEDTEGEAKKIETFDRHGHYQENWKRPPNKTEQGATHIRTFVAKLRLDAIEHLDEQVNEWLDEHPEYEVKLVTTSIGILTGKLKEDAIFMTVWV